MKVLFILEFLKQENIIMFISNMTLNIYHDLKMIFLYFNMFQIPY